MSGFASTAVNCPVPQPKSSNRPVSPVDNVRSKHAVPSKNLLLERLGESVTSTGYQNFGDLLRQQGSSLVCVMKRRASPMRRSIVSWSRLRQSLLVAPTMQHLIDSLNLKMQPRDRVNEVDATALISLPPGTSRD